MKFKRAQRVSDAIYAWAEEELLNWGTDRTEFQARLRYWDGVLAQARYRNTQHHRRLRLRDERAMVSGCTGHAS